MYDYLELMEMYSWDVEQVHRVVEETRNVETI